MSRSLRICLYALGSGETSQSYAVAVECQKRGYEVTFIVKKPETLGFLKSTKQFSFVGAAPLPEDFASILKKHPQDVLILCNSKIFRHFPEIAERKTPPFDVPLVVTLDSNWLFIPSSKTYQYVRWAHRYFVNFPKEVFELGLKRNGGYFPIPHDFAERIEPVGVLPSYESPSAAEKQAAREQWGIKQGEPLIFCYFSGTGAAGRGWIVSNLVRALNASKKLSNVRVIASGNAEAFQTLSDSVKQRVKYLGCLDTQEFHKCIAASDLVFQHQGLATLEQAICVQTPVVASVSVDPKEEYPGIHPAEVGPFARAGLCRMKYRTSSAKSIAADVEALLFDGPERSRMQAAQAKLTSHGEQQLMDRIEELMRERDGVQA